MTTELAAPEQQGQAAGRVDEYAYRGALYGMGIALVLLRWLSLRTAWRGLFLSYATLAAIGLWVAWRQVPETGAAAPSLGGRPPMALWPLMRVLLVACLSYLFMTMIRPVFLVFLHDEFTQDVWLLALASLPAMLVDSCQSGMGLPPVEAVIRGYTSNDVVVAIAQARWERRGG
jgi:hypothetical protein